MRYSDISVLMDETPGEISIAFSITGCGMGCPGCHSKEFWDGKSGEELTDEIYLYHLNKNKGSATAVLFFGGEWNQDELIAKLKLAQFMGYKTILYTGRGEVTMMFSPIIKFLDFIKTGQYNEKAGPITSKTTNQRYMNVKTGENMNHYFIN